MLPDGLPGVDRLIAGAPRPAVVLLDVDLSGRGEFEDLPARSQIGVGPRTPVTVTTARSTESDASGPDQVRTATAAKEWPVAPAT